MHTYIAIYLCVCVGVYCMYTHYVTVRFSNGVKYNVKNHCYIRNTFFFHVLLDSDLTLPTFMLRFNAIEKFNGRLWLFLSSCSSYLTEYWRDCCRINLLRSVLLFIVLENKPWWKKQRNHIWVLERTIVQLYFGPCRNGCLSRSF